MARLSVGLSVAVVAASVLFGGSSRSGIAVNFIPQFLGLVLFALVANRASSLFERNRLAFVLIAGMLLVPLVQLVPTPPAVWSLLPGRAEVLATFKIAGAAPPWSPLSLQPGETWRALFALIPAVGLYLAVRAAGSHQRLLILLALIGLGVISVIVSILQALGDGAVVAHASLDGGGRGAGFFANPNHFVTYLVVLCLLVGALLSAPKPGGSLLPLIGGGGVFIVLVLGLALSGSRSSLPLGSLAILAVLAMFARPLLSGVAQKRFGVIVGVLVLVVVFPALLGMGLLATVERVQQQNLVEDARWLIASVTWRAIWPYFPIGSGIGTFQAVYQRHEPASAVMFEIINDAHNDALQIVLEAGVVGLILLGVWVLFLARASVRAFSHKGERDARIAKAAAVGLWLMTLHSLWDYPLRTGALIATAAVLAAVLTPPRDADRPVPSTLSGMKFFGGDGRRRRA